MKNLSRAESSDSLPSMRGCENSELLSLPTFQIFYAKSLNAQETSFIFSSSLSLNFFCKNLIFRSEYWFDFSWLLLFHSDWMILMSWIRITTTILKHTHPPPPHTHIAVCDDLLNVMLSPARSIHLSLLLHSSPPPCFSFFLFDSTLTEVRKVVLEQHHVCPEHLHPL